MQRPPDEQYPAWQTNLPSLSEFPDDTEAWRAMDRSLVAKCLNFPNRIDASQNKIAQAIEYVMHELEDVLDEQASARGVEAWEIASALRKTYKLDRAEIIFDYYDALLKALKQTREAVEKKSAAQVEFLQELSARDQDAPDQSAPKPNE